MASRLSLAPLLLATALAHADFDPATDLLIPPLLTGDFRQENHVPGLDAPRIATGRFALARDHGLLWQVQQPEQAGWVITRDGARRVAGEAATMPRRVGRLIDSLISGALFADERFTAEVRGDGSAWQVTLIPVARSVARQVERIEVSGGAYVQAVTLHWRAGRKVQLNFSGFEEPSALPEPACTALAVACAW